jgi:hypothetical protein
MVDIITVPPNAWTEVAGVEVSHPYGNARVLEVANGVLLIDGEWRVRAHQTEPRTVEHRTMSGAGGLFVQPSAAGRSSVRSGRTLGPVFTARFDSVCEPCGGDIYEGDEARMYDGTAMHPDCAEREAE